MRPRTVSKPIFSLFILALLGFDWGTGFSIARFATTNGVSPMGYSFWQSFGPALLVGSIALFRVKSFELNIARLRFYLVAGIIGIVIPNTVMYFAAPHLPTSMVAMIVNTVPIIAYPLALLAGTETFHWQRMAGVCLAFCGLMLLILNKAALPSSDKIAWALFTLITPLSFAGCSIYVARYRPANCDAFTLAAGMLISASFFLTPMVLFTHSFYAFHLPLTAADGVVLTEILLSSIGYVLYFQLIKVAGPVYFSMVDTIVASTGLFWGYFIFNERLNQWTATAVFLILFALLLVTRLQKANIIKQARNNKPLIQYD